MTSIPVMRPFLGPEEQVAAAEAVASGWVAQGPRVAQFEREFAARVQAGYGVAVSSCTAALHLGMVLHGIGRGDEVVVPSLSFIATANAVRCTGATPVFADVDVKTGNITAKTVDAVRTTATRAVLVVHQAGVPADLDELHGLCDPAGLPVLEDAACAAGSTHRDRPVGAGSALAAWSFHPRKLLTTGEGGMLTVEDEAAAVRLRRLREHGMDVSAADRHAGSAPVVESYLETGFNYRLTDIQAAVGLVQLGRLDAVVTRRRELAARYQALLAEVPGLLTVGDPTYGTTNYQSFWVLLPDDFPITRNRLMVLMHEAGISTRRGIMAAHLEPAYAGHPHGDLSKTEQLSEQSVILPLFHEMTDEQQDRVVAVLRAAARTSPGK
ncbi:MAG: DegT/DnrJ/EryC1/StrS family aminotransferase [Mycobacteriales bacterium]